MVALLEQVRRSLDDIARPSADRPEVARFVQTCRRVYRMPAVLEAALTQPEAARLRTELTSAVHTAIVHVVRLRATGALENDPLLVESAAILADLVLDPTEREGCLT